jgi:hypothetical protein
MLNYSTHNLSNTGTILNTDVYSLDKILSTQSTHVGIIDPNSNYLIYDKGVSSISLNNSNNFVNKGYDFFNINTDYNSLTAANSTKSYITLNNIDVATHNGVLEESFASPLLPLLAGFSLPYFYAGIRKIIKSISTKDKKNLTRGIVSTVITGVPSIMFLNNLNKCYTNAKSLDLITKVSGLKGMYYNIGLFAISNGFYNIFNGIKDIKQHNKNIKNKLGNKGLKSKGYAELIFGTSEFVGGGLMTYSSSMNWLTLNSSMLSTQGAIVGSMLGGIGISIFAIGLAVKFTHYLYIKIKSKKTTGKLSNNVYTQILRP